MVQVSDEAGKTSDLQAKNIVVATGATASVPRGWAVDGEKVVTYREAILQEKLPKSVIVIGSGAMGVEFATVWSSYGVEVTIVEMLPRVVPLEDEEVSAELEKAFKKRGIKVLTEYARRVDRGDRERRPGEGERSGRRERAGGGAGAGGDRLHAQRAQSRAGSAGREGERARRGGDRRAHGDQRAGHLGDRRRDRQADAGARRLGAGHRVRREHRRRRDGDAELRDDAARHLLLSRRSPPSD